MKTSWSALLLLFGASTVFAAPREQLDRRQLFKKVSSDGSCGGSLFSGTTCQGSSFGNCCSPYGWCGSSAAHCGSGCQSLFGTCTPTNPLQKISSNGQCGGLLGLGQTCAGSVFGSCCSSSGWCGSTDAYCGTGCQGTYGKCGITSSAAAPAPSSVKPAVSSVARVVSSVVPSPVASVASAPAPSSSLKVSQDGSCGGTTGQTCVGSTFGSCCSSYGWCGSTDIYCSSGCQPAFGICPSSSSAASAVSSATVSASKVSAVSASSASSAPTCASTIAPAAGILPNCVRCQGQPGSDQFCGYGINDDYLKVTPKTCKVVYYELDITETTISPDGRPRFAQVVNGQMPGPEIRASWGDTVVVKVNNKLSINGTTIHFHGLRQLNNTMNDGVPSITQCPIPPGSSFTYTWVAQNYGSSWYHSHFAIQTWEGVFGPLNIDGPTTASYDTDLGSVMIQDWDIRTVDQQYGTAENAATNPATGKPYGGPVVLQTGLINGKNIWYPPATNATSNSTAPATTGVQPGQTGSRTTFNGIKSGLTYRIRVINTSIQSTYKFYIDNHTFKVIASDFVPIKPYTTNILNINIGQRYDILVTADQLPGNYWLRADNQQSCAGTIQAKDIKAIFSYDGSGSTLPTTTAYNYTDACLDEPLASIVPQVPINVGPADVSEPTMNVLIAGNSAQLYKWTLNSYTFLQQWDQPTLLSIDQTGTYSNSSGPLLFDLPVANQWVYLIIQSPVPLPHPIHLHGHDFHVLAAGKGTYSASTPLQLVNPPRRDTALLPAAGYLVIAFQTDNPGTWLAHCHIGWHVSMGFALQFTERKSEIKSSGGLSNSCGLRDNCAKWSAFASSNGIVQADSGV